MRQDTFEIIPLVDEPEPYQWVAPEQAEYFTVYRRDAEGLAHAVEDLPSLDAALVLALRQRHEHVTLWTGRMFVDVSSPRPLALLR